MHTNVIVFESFEKFIEACYLLTSHSVVFKAEQDGETYVIRITGY